MSVVLDGSILGKRRPAQRLNTAAPGPRMVRPRPDRIPIETARPAESPLTPEANHWIRPDLSAREVEVLLAWLATESKEGAAERLFISASTVSTHISRIRAKYAAVGRSAPTKTHLLARALQDGITTIDDW